MSRPTSPSTKEIIDLRIRLGWTRTRCGRELAGYGRPCQSWSNLERGVNAMPAATWALVLIRAEQALETPGGHAPK